MPGYGGPRLYRFYNYEQIDYLPAPVAGWNPDANPWDMPSNQAPQLDNFLIMPGRISMRSPVEVLADVSAIANPLFCCGYVVMDDGILLSRRVADATKVIEPWDVPLVRPASNTQLAVAQTTGVFVPFSGAPVSQAWSGVSNPSGVAPGPRAIEFDGAIYGLSYLTATSSILDKQGDYAINQSILYSINTKRKSNISAGTPITVALSAPIAALDLKGHLGRIWLLGGADTPTGGTTFSPTVLYFSNPIVAGGGGVATDWKDPVTGLLNKIVMDNNVTDPGIGLGTTRNALVIFRRNSVWVLRGTTTQSFVLQPIAKDIGCLDPRSIVECDKGIYFMSRQGLMLTDGVTVRNVSGSVLRTLQEVIGIEQNAVLQAAGGYISCASTSQGHIMVSIGVNDVTGGGTTPSGHLAPLWGGMYDPASGAWTRITSTVWTNDAVLYLGAQGPQLPDNLYPGLLLRDLSHQRLYAIGDKYVTRLEDLTISRSFVSNLGPVQRAFYDLLPSGANPAVSIPAKWTSKFAATGSETMQRKLGIAKRFFFDYSFTIGTALNLPGFAVQTRKADTTSYSTTLIAAANPNNALQASISGVATLADPQILRQNADFTDEVDDVQFVVSWSDQARTNQAGATSVGDVFGIGIEFQKTRDRR